MPFRYIASTRFAHAASNSTSQKKPRQNSAPQTKAQYNRRARPKSRTLRKQVIPLVESPRLPKQGRLTAERLSCVGPQAGAD